MTRLDCLPARFDATALAGIMAKIGLPLPVGVWLHPSGRRRPRPAVRFHPAVVDAAIGRSDLDPASRTAVKIAIENQGLVDRPTRKKAKTEYTEESIAACLAFLKTKLTPAQLEEARKIINFHGEISNGAPREIRRRNRPELPARQNRRGRSPSGRRDFDA